MTTTISALYDDYNDTAAAVKELRGSSIPEADISIIAHNAEEWRTDEQTGVANDAGTGAGIGAAVGGGVGLLAGLGILAIPYVGPLVVGGWLLATVEGAMAGGVAGATMGAIVGAMTASGISVDDANVYAEGVRRGGALVIARVEDDCVNMANGILRHYRSVDIAARRSDYQSGGWTTFDEDAPAFTDAQVREERSRYLRAT